MADGNPIVNLGELSKPATVLIEKVSEAIGGVFKPFQIVRVAKAEAEAERIRTTNLIELTELQQRALQRFLAEEAKHQANIEQITASAVPLLTDDSRPEEIGDDWISNFFDRCRGVSDSEMQQLWSRLLAGEANTPGAFSRKTVNLVADLDKSAAELFSRLCRFKCNLAGRDVPIVLNIVGEIYANAGLSSSAFADLESLGLIKMKQEGHFFKGGLGQVVHLTYSEEILELKLVKERDNRFLMGRALFTKAGHELSALCDSPPVDGFADYLQKQLVTNYQSCLRRQS